MDEKRIEKKVQEELVVEKKVYTPPTVTVYGKLTELTAAASKTGTAAEHSSAKTWRT